MKSVFILFVVIIYEQIECKTDFSGLDFAEPVDYNTACGEPFDGEFPWLVKIFKIERKRFETTKRFLCNGNIIDKYRVLLPAHCVVTYDDKKGNPNDFTIEVGKTTFSSGTKTTKEYKGRDVIVHPDFKGTYLNDDIAILKLSEPIEFSSYVHPICLTNDLTKFNTTQSGIVPVWTYLNEDENKDILNTAYLPIIYNNTECLERESVFSDIINDHNFCAGRQNESYSLCRGSTGVSLSLIEETQTKFIWYLKGILSVGKNNPENVNSCANGPLIFTDVFKYYNWINENKTN